MEKNQNTWFRINSMRDFQDAEVARTRLAEGPWHQIEGNEVVIAEMGERLALTAQQQTVMTFSGLVRGLAFRNPVVSGTARKEIATENGAVLRTVDQALVDSLLLLLSLHSFKHGDIIASALVVPGAAGPSKGFISVARTLRTMSQSAMSDADLWTRELKRVYTRFAQS